MNASLWVGALASLIGVALGGGISFVLSRQQMKDARAQRIEDDLRANRRRSENRRFSAYSDFLILARTYRESLRPLSSGQAVSKASLKEIDSLSRSVSNSSALIFIVVESEVTYQVCRAMIRCMNEIQTVLHNLNTDQTMAKRTELIVSFSNLLREFQVAVRDELGVTGIEPLLILARGVVLKGFSDPKNDKT